MGDEDIGKIYSPEGPVDRNEIYEFYLMLAPMDFQRWVQQLTYFNKCGCVCI